MLSRACIRFAHSRFDIVFPFSFADGRRASNFQQLETRKIEPLCVCCVPLTNKTRTHSTYHPSRVQAPRSSTVLTVLKILPLALYLRSASCKLGLPILGCDGPLCPVAIGKSGNCTPTANTAEQQAWCEHAWTPWANNLLSTFKIPYRVRCSKSDGFEFSKIIACVEIIGYLMLWVPGTAKKGAFILTATMAFALHFHLTFLKDSADKLGLQFVLLFAGLAVYLMETNGNKSGKIGSKPRPPKKGGSKKRN